MHPLFLLPKAIYNHERKNTVRPELASTQARNLPNEGRGWRYSLCR